jgi:peptidoglycan/LPS O-acetylase OafA/YrhL
MGASSTAAARDRAGPIGDAVPRRLIAGDGLRAIAAIGVLALHAATETMFFKHAPGFVTNDEHVRQYAAIAGAAAPLLTLTRVSIYIFFALSGYLLSRGFLASYTLGTPRPSVRRYARNRALRIVPAFWVVMVVYLTWDHAWRSGGIGGLLAALGFAQNYHYTGAAVLRQAWTLDIEVAFYALIPIAALLALRLRRPGRGTPLRRLSLVLAICGLAFLASQLLIHRAGQPAGNTYFLGDWLFAFMPGVALAAAEPFLAPWLRARPDGGRWAWRALAASAALLVAEVYAPANLHALHQVLAALGCGALLGATLALQWAAGRSWRVLDAKPMRWIGERSYGIYLIHIGVMGHLLRHLGGYGYTVTFLLLTVSSALVSAIAAEVLWRLVERPAMQRRLPWRQAEFARVRARLSRESV